MFENKTFENILSDMLSYVSDRNPDLDTREGSIIYTALAPIALELETAYHEMNMIIDETFLETASKEYLVKHGDQVGVELNEATAGHFKGEFNVDLAIGTRFNLGKFNYSVIEKLSNPSGEGSYYAFELVCETSGSEPNSYLGDLKPITYVSGLSYAKLTSVITYGEDEEDTEAYRYRLQTHVKNPPINGNVAQYAEWLDQYPRGGIGRYRILPRWNGINTVKLVIATSENTSPDTEKIAEVQNYFDPNKTGMGDGIAPIGSVVTVEAAQEVKVKINCTVKREDNSTEEIKDTVDKYLKSIAFDKNTIAYMPIYAEIYNTEGVKEVVSLTITVNGSAVENSVTIGDNEVPVLDKENSVWSVQQ